MRILTRHTIFLFLLIAISGCEDRLALDIDFSGERILIVDAVLTTEVKKQEIVLSRMKKSPNDSTKYVSGALVQVSTEDRSVQFFESDSMPGYYYSDISFGAAANAIYFLEIQSGEQEYHAAARLGPLFERNTLNVRRADTLGNYFVVPPEEFNPAEAAMYEISIDDPRTVNPVDSRFYYYTLTSVDISQVLSGSQPRVTFRDDVTITQRKYGLSAAHEEFIRTMLLETRWRGNAFDVESTNVYSNLSNGALGIFALSALYETDIEF